jgi:hypothetical protein
MSRLSRTKRAGHRGASLRRHGRCAWQAALLPGAGWHLPIDSRPHHTMEIYVDAKDEALDLAAVKMGRALG